MPGKTVPPEKRSYYYGTEGVNHNFHVAYILDVKTVQLRGNLDYLTYRHT